MPVNEKGCGEFAHQQLFHFVPYVQQAFPNLIPGEIYRPWNKADMGDLKIRKPDERIFQLTMEKLAVKASECLYVDDRRGYLEAAGKVGMHTILFNSRNVPYEGNMVNSFEELMNINCLNRKI